MSGLFGIGSSALLASQRALATTGHNIANANTDGYSRQRVDFSARHVAGQLLGQGVESNNIQRYSDPFANTRLVQSTSSHASIASGADLTRRLDLSLSDPATGLADPLRNFIDSVDAWAADPTAPESRINVLGQAETLAQRFGQIQDGFDNFNIEINSRISSNVDEINNLTSGIAQLNEEIAMNQTFQPNDLLDQRDLMVRQLSQRIDVQTATQDDGSVNVFAGNGQALVVGKQASQLDVVPGGGPADPIGVALNGANLNNQIEGGELGGLLNFRQDVLVPTQTQMRDLANGLVTAVNAVQANGADLNGVAGADLLSISPTSARISVEISDPDLLASAASGAAAGSGDNSNALQMADVLKGPILGNASAAEANIALVGRVGTTARRLEAAETAQSAVLQQHQNLRDEVSAVNLDEEAANMLQYQQAYQAAAQIIATANEMFETLLAAAR
ncbi:MAG: flagellar hook-associated protein FlgK [Oceanococcus sp.]